MGMAKKKEGLMQLEDIPVTNEMALMRLANSQVSLSVKGKRRNLSIGLYAPEGLREAFVVFPDKGDSLDYQFSTSESGAQLLSAHTTKGYTHLMIQHGGEYDITHYHIHRSQRTVKRNQLKNIETRSFFHHQAAQTRLGESPE